jgi:hypothetical protein
MKEKSAKISWTQGVRLKPKLPNKKNSSRRNSLHPGLPLKLLDNCEPQ